jgi:hypothetical protein
MPELVYEKFNDLLGPFGEVVLAGGCVRDYLMGRPPKDFDVFVLNNHWDEEVKADVLDVLAHLDKVTVPEWHVSEPYLVTTVMWQGAMVQVMLNPAETMRDLIETFDWNVCLFGYDSNGVHAGMRVTDIAEGKYLELQTVTYPLSTLRRGFRFSERFLMRLHKQDIVELCARVLTKMKRGEETGMFGAEPGEAFQDIARQRLVR